MIKRHSLIPDINSQGGKELMIKKQTPANLLVLGSLWQNYFNQATKKTQTHKKMGNGYSINLHLTHIFYGFIHLIFSAA